MANTSREEVTLALQNLGVDFDPTLKVKELKEILKQHQEKNTSEKDKKTVKTESDESNTSNVDKDDNNTSSEEDKKTVNTNVLHSGLSLKKGDVVTKETPFFDELLALGFLE